MPLIVVSNDPTLNNRKRGSSSGLQIITDEEFKYRCLTPGCDAAFFDGQERAWVAHCERCSESNEGEIREQYDIETQMPGLFGPESGDVEFKKWHRENKGWKC
jgi:hypothetical protein